MFKYLSFCNLLDSHGNLSITNLVVYATLIKFICDPTLSITLALLFALCGYAHKRYVNAKAFSNNVDVKSQINSAINNIHNKITVLESSVTGILLQSGIKRN